MASFEQQDAEFRARAEVMVALSKYVRRLKARALAEIKVIYADPDSANLDPDEVGYRAFESAKAKVFFGEPAATAALPHPDSGA